MKTSLILSTYNRPEALRLCLLSIFGQRVLPDEIIIGDDGSRKPTFELIKEMQAQSPVQIKHVWQEDDGFRLAMMRNKCVAGASGEYIIEIDGDLILHPEFVADHLSFARRGCYVKGGRTNLGPALTQELCRSCKLRPLTWHTKGIEGKAENALHLPRLAKWLAPRYRKGRETALGANMSFFKDDYISINGYDEYYEGWGGEDQDFGIRLQMLGLKKLHLKFAGIAFHLWHEDKYMYNKKKNFQHYNRKDIKTRCDNGVDKYLE